MSAFDEYKWRGMIYDVTEGLEATLAAESVTAYIGFDPSAPSLHVGSLLPIMALARLQRHGHRPIAIVGGGTGLIGDPSGKTEERKLLTKEEVENNLQRIKGQLSRFLDFEAEDNGALIINNADWLVPVNMMDFLRDVGKYFTVNYMLAKESVGRRLEQGISFTEFSYMLLQAYDFLVLYDKYNCTLQMGGSDQWGNILAGIELTRRVRRGKAHGLVFPLVTNSTGVKFGKTESGTIWLNADPSVENYHTSPFRLYQFFLNTDDRDVVTYLKYFTWLSQDRIGELESIVSAEPERREAQRTLAREITRMLHGETALARAETASRVLFGEEITELGVADVLEVFGDVPSTRLSASQFQGDGVSIVDLVLTTNLSESKAEARRLIQGGGIYLNNARATDPRHRVSIADSIGGQILVLRKGPKQYHLVKIDGDYK
ncbi:MAG TPA: tyrosine--tRNA ligase [Pyrinomonadaceae bacterium]|jgi:tyrosyl-tRNA synthetase|nr:tyrosine--tRNA ligase [Pyrinomonadaceae bacterium]